MKRKSILIFIFFILGVTLSLQAGNNYIMVVNPQNPLNFISKEDVKKIYLGEMTIWENGNKIRVAALKEGDVHETFLEDTVKLSPLRFAHYWQQIVFTGSGTAPRFFKTDVQIKEYVKATPDAIGYISEQSLDDTVKKIPVK